MHQQNALESNEKPSQDEQPAPILIAQQHEATDHFQDMRCSEAGSLAQEAPGEDGKHTQDSALKPKEKAVMVSVGKSKMILAHNQMSENVTYLIPSNARHKLFSMLKEHSIMVAHNSVQPTDALNCYSS